MSKVPIPKSHRDPFYRYTRDVVQVTHTGRHGGRTQVENLAAIAAQIYRKPEDLHTVYQRQLQMRVQVADGKLVLQGVHTAATLDDILEQYIERVVVCQLCGNPETGGGVCAACGHRVRAK